MPHASPPPEARELSGRVLDPGGTPLAEALVTVNPDEGDTVSAALVEDDGSYLVSPAPPGPFTLTIGAAGYQGVEHRIEAGSDDVRIEAVLAREDSKECRSRPPAPAAGPGAIVTGRVRGPFPADREILVLLQGEDTVRHQALAADATFRWDDVPSGAWEVVADAGPGRIAGRALTIAPWQSEGSAEIEVDLEIPAAPPAALPSPDRASAEVRVVDRSGQPLSGATVHAGSAARLRQEPRTRATTAGGTVRLDGLPPYESLWLLIERKGFVPEVRDLALQPAEHRALQVTLLPGVSAAGQVVDEAGRPVPGAEVELAGDVLGPELPDDAPDFLSGRATLRTRTGRAGRFRFDDLPEGDYEIHLRHPSHVPVHAVYAVDGNDLGQLALRRGTAGPDRPEPPDVKPEATVRGRVVDPSGHPVAGAVLRPKPASSDPWDVLDTGLAEIQGYSLTAVTDAAGRFSLGLLPGWYRLEARADGWKSNRSGTLRAAAGQTIDGIEIRLQRGAVVFGRVLDAAGAPIAGARVQSGSAETASQADGSFRLDGLPFGPATLKVENSVSWLHRFEPLSREIELTSGATRVDLVLLEDPQCGCIPVPVRGRVLGPDDAPVAEARVALFQGGRTWSAADGSFEIPVPAHWKVEIQAHKRGFADGWVQLNAGGAPVEGLEIRLTAGTLVTGRVLGLAGATPDPTDSVALEPLQPGTAPWFEAPLHADDTFRLRHAPPGSWELSTEISERKAATALTLTPGPAEIRTDLQLPAVHPVSGRVSDELGRPLAGMGITAWWESSGHGITSTDTNADGLFTFDLPDGEYRLQVRNDGYQEDGRELQVQGAPIAGLDFRLERATLLHGRLLGLAPTEKPVIRAEPVPGSPGRSSSAQRSARLDTYAIPDLHPGLWRIEANTPTCTLRRTIEVLPGATEIEMDLDFAPTEAKP